MPLTARVTRTDAWQYRTLQNLEPKVTDIAHGLSALLLTLIYTEREFCPPEPKPTMASTQEKYEEC